MIVKGFARFLLLAAAFSTTDAAKNKKGKSGWKQSNRDKNLEVDGSKLGPSLIDQKGKAEFWTIRETFRTWSESDMPVDHPDMLSTYSETSKILESVDFDQLKIHPDDIFKLYDFLEKFIDLGFPLVSLLDGNTTFGAFIDSKEGEDMAPILASGCTLDLCVAPIYDGENLVEEALVSYEELYAEYESKSINGGQFLSEFEELSKTFTVEQTKDILCNKKSIDILRLSVDSSLSGMKEKTEKFLQDPSSYSQSLAERRLIMVSERASSKMVLQLVDALCDGVPTL